MLLFHFKTIESTHEWLKSHFSEICDTRSSSIILAAVTAERQTKAKGRHSVDNWHCTSGSISCSFLIPLYDEFPRSSWGILPLLSANSLLTTTRKYCSSNPDLLYLKWPNDLYSESGKVGISIVETIDSHCEHGFAIISIYANLNKGSKDLYSNIPNVSTIEDISSNNIQHDKFFLDLSKQLTIDIKSAISNKEELFTREFKSWANSVSTIQFQYENKTFFGKPIDVLTDGSIVIHTNKKEQIIVQSNEPFKSQNVSLDTFMKQEMCVKK